MKKKKEKIYVVGWYGDWVSHIHDDNTCSWTFLEGCAKKFAEYKNAYNFKKRVERIYELSGRGRDVAVFRLQEEHFQPYYWNRYLNERSDVPRYSFETF